MSRQSEIREKLEKAVATYPLSGDRILIPLYGHEIRYLLDRLEAATRLLQLAREDLAVGRRFLPKHGSFGEEGIDNYEYTQRVVEQFLKESQ